MSTKNGNTASRDPRKAVFKMLSDTLRSPPGKYRRASTKSSLSKINKLSPRTLSKALPDLHKSENKSGKSVNHAPNQTRLTKPGKSNIVNKPPIGRNTLNNIERPFHPVPMKDCHLSNVLRSAKRCLCELREAKESLSNIVAADEQLSRGIKKQNPTDDHMQLSQVSLSITNLCREAFVPAHRLNQAAIALYCAEDFLRYPNDIRTFNVQSNSGRIKLPDTTFNNATVMKLRQVVDLAAETYNQFNGKGPLGEELQEILFCILRGYQDFYAATLGCQEIFKVLLYTGAKDKAHLQQFLLALPPIDRSDMLIEIQDLRRILDEIVIFLEKLSWGSFVIYQLAGGSPQQAQASTPESPPVTNTSSVPTYPAYPLLKAQGQKPRQKKTGMDCYEPHRDSSETKMKPAGASGKVGEIDRKEKPSGISKKSRFSKKKMTISEEECLEVFPIQKRHFAPGGDSAGDTNNNKINDIFTRLDARDSLNFGK